MEIPYHKLSSEALWAIVEDFVLLHGTDYGAVEVSHDVKVAQVMEQIKQGKVLIRFDPKTQTCGLFPKE